MWSLVASKGTPPVVVASVVSSTWTPVASRERVIVRAAESSACVPIREGHRLSVERAARPSLRTWPSSSRFATLPPPSPARAGTGQTLSHSLGRRARLIPMLELLIVLGSTILETLFVPALLAAAAAVEVGAFALTAGASQFGR